ncbi:DUF1735 domain-containing protein [Mucilaginibacter sp.]|uniref:DUF1735 domain-containing protein n=1 Tax=Mucilaginibacter sp. TaxID=1882438 RepID=UPI0025D5930F|nr:DUF1735 domain-containing protein [Mucilaginibacter sp.]
MKKLIILLGVLTVSLTSCLKDKPNVDFSNIGAFAEIVHSGSPYFGEAAITDAQDTISRTLQINVTGQYAPTKDVTVTVALDNSIIAPYNAANTAVTYLPMPTGSFVFATTTVTIKAGTRLANIPVTFYKNQLDPSKSYMLPIKITNSSLPLGANFSIKYYHFIGNDFAGTYKHQFTRTPAAGNFTYDAGKTSAFLPDSPTQFEVAGSYYTGDIRYVVKFTKTGAGASATYSHFSVTINTDDVAKLGAVTPPILVTTAPSITGYTEKEYTFTQALALFDNGLTYGVTGGSGVRVNLDQYKE